VSEADAVAGVLWVGATAYAVFGGADFGAGFWSLVSRRDTDGAARARALRLGHRPGVGEANHVWLILRGWSSCGTGFSSAVRGDLLDVVHPR